jgi:ketopantoate reductase
MTSGSQVHRGSDSRIVEFCMTLLTQAGSPLKASALRDIERGAPTEGEHVLGKLQDEAHRSLNFQRHGKDSWTDAKSS